MTAERAVLLFSYGNLQQKELQVAIFGRDLGGRKDFLPGYARAITDVGNVAYYNIEPSGEEAVSGIVLEITEQELAAADRYGKERGYRRIPVTLQSGVQAWVYQRILIPFEQACG